MTQRRSKRTRGQAIVLMAFTAAFLAFTVLTTLAIGKAVRERVQLQNAADASAYSLAVQEARAFNFYAYTNRAVISHFVAMMAVYGHMSYLAYFEGVLNDLSQHWGCSGDWATSIPAQMLYEWIGWCAICADPFGGEWACPMCEGDSECVPEEMDEINSDICNPLGQKLQDVDQDLGKSGGSSTCFQDLTKIAKQHREGVLSGGSLGGLSLGTGFSAQLTNEQAAVDVNLQAAMVDQKMTKEIAQQFDPNYGVGKSTAAATAVGLLNVVGVPGDKHTAGYCNIGATGKGPVTSTTCALTGSDVTTLSTQEQAANASRYGPGGLIYSSYDWLRNRADGITSMIEIAYIVGSLQIVGERTSLLTSGTGMSRETVDPSGNVVSTVQSTDQGGYDGTSGGGGNHSFAGEDHGNLFSIDLTCIENITLGIGDSSPQTWAYSEPSGSGSQSQIGWADGSTTDTDDYDIGGKEGNTYGVDWPTINYNPSDDPATLFNQPHTWALVTKSFNDSNLTAAINSQSYGNTQDEGPFAMKRQISLDGTNKYNYNNGITLQSGDPDYSPGREAMYAVAQGLAYYHRPGNWQEPPNFYNPYWRAKLQPVQMSSGGSTADAKVDIAAILIAGGYPATEAAEIAAMPVTE